MAGEGGLVSLLEAEGYSVRRVRAVVPEIARQETFAAAPEPLPEPVHPGVLAWRDAVPNIATSICSTPTPVRECFFQDETACTARLTDDIEMCVQQQLPSLPRLAESDQATANSVVGCGISGVLMEAMIFGRVKEGEACDALMEQMREAFQGALTQ